MTETAPPNNVLFTATLGGNNTGGTSNFTGNITLARDVILQAATGGAVEFKSGTWTTGNKAITVGSTGNEGSVKISNALTTTAGVTVANGTLNIGGTLTAPVTVNGGATLAGNGSIDGGTVLLNGTLAPGNSAGTLAINNALTLGAASATQMQLGGTSTSQYDRVIGLTNLSLGGTVAVSLIDSFMPTFGNTFDLFDWSGTLTPGGFNVATNLVLPALGAGLTWDTSGFLSDGQIAVVPEPATLSLLGSGALLLLRRRNRVARSVKH